MTLMNRLLDSVEAQDFYGDPDEEIVASALALLALAISRLPPPQREAALQGIEDGQTLRRAVGMFPERGITTFVLIGGGVAH